MPGRTRSKDRCARCRMREVLCLCAELPRLQLRTRVTVLMNWREARTTTNTGRVAALALEKGEVRVRGGERGDRLDCSGLLREGERPLILFPWAGARELSPELAAEGGGRPIHLIVPDATWRQARKLVTREPPLRGIPFVRLPAGPPSSYRLRKSGSAANLCTFEAIARALGVLEGAEVRDQLETLFERMIERALWSRGQLKASETRTGIPAEAIRRFDEDGRRGGGRPRNPTPTGPFPC